jgi:hypothetical protein
MLNYRNAMFSYMYPRVFRKKSLVASDFTIVITLATEVHTTGN